MVFYVKRIFFFSVEKVQKELDVVLGSSHQICYEDRKKLPYTNAVVHEIIRFSSIILITIPREVVKDTTVLGYHLPKVPYLFQYDLCPQVEFPIVMFSLIHFSLRFSGCW